MPAREVELLRRLFIAHRDANEEMFQHAAQSLIERYLSGNHHAQARDLLKALGPGLQRHVERAQLARLPSTSGAPTLLTFPTLSRVAPILSDQTERSVSRVLNEFRGRETLAAHGLRPATRLIFFGPPGCGKTMTARFIAAELGLPLALLNLSSILSSLLGGTAAQLAGVFDVIQARPTLLLMDEFDTIARERDDQFEIGESKRIVNSLLQLLEYFTTGNSLVIAATNHETALDRAAWRRFDSAIAFPLPNEQQRRELASRELSGTRFTGSLSIIAKQTARLSYGDVSKTVTDAVKAMVLEKRKSLTTEDVLREVRAFKGNTKYAATR